MTEFQKGTDMDQFHLGRSYSFRRCARCRRWYPKPKADVLGLDEDAGAFARVACALLDHTFPTGKGSMVITGVDHTTKTVTIGEKPS